MNSITNINQGQGRTRPRRVGWLLVPLMLGLVAGVVLVAARFANAAKPTPLLSIGKIAPDFALQDQDGRTQDLRDYRGRTVVLAFFPELTPAVQTELRSLRDKLPTFDSTGAKVFGVTGQAGASVKAFHDSENLRFPILADPNGSAARLFGARDAVGHIKNASFVVDGEKTLMLAMNEDEIQPATHANQIVTIAACCFVPQSTASLLKPGQTVADFALPRVDGGAQESLFRADRPKATVAVFLSIKCPCSQAYEARLQSLAQTYQRQGIRFLGIDSSADETVGEIAPYVQRAAFGFPVVKDERNAIADRLGARISPEFFVLDAGGKLRYHGPLDDSRDPAEVKTHLLADALDALLSGKTPPKAEAQSIGCAITRIK